MAAANVTTLPELEIEQVERWRLDTLRRAGYDAESAALLAATHEIDLHDAVELLERGCSVTTAVRILL
jgi:hypothetical protein